MGGGGGGVVRGVSEREGERKGERGKLIGKGTSGRCSFGRFFFFIFM